MYFIMRSGTFRNLGFLWHAFFANSPSEIPAGGFSGIPTKTLSRSHPGVPGRVAPECCRVPSGILPGFSSEITPGTHSEILPGISPGIFPESSRNFGIVQELFPGFL